MKHASIMNFFRKNEFKDYCAIITSYDPSHKDIVNEEIGENTQTNKQYIYDVYTRLLRTVEKKPKKSKQKPMKMIQKDYL